MPTVEVDRATKKSDVCDGCGACCAPGILGQVTDPYLEITPDDLRDGFKSTKKLAAKDQMFGEGGRLFLPVIRGESDFTQCEHLRGAVLEGATCSCYDTRPTACRIFEPGGVMCQRLRQAWLVHQDKVMWEKHAHPECSYAEAVYAVVARDNGLNQYSVDNRILESLGAGPDYIHLRKVRDEEQRKKETKCLPKDTVAQGERKRMARAVGDFRGAHVAHEGMGHDPSKALSKRQRMLRTFRKAHLVVDGVDTTELKKKKGAKSAHSKAKQRNAR